MPKSAIHEARRLAALYSYHLLDTPAEEGLEELTSLAGQICAAPVAAISLVDENRQWFKSSLGLPLRQTPRKASFCTEAIAQREVFVVPDADADPRFVDCPLRQGSRPIRFYAGAPLLNPQGLALGTLCVMDYVPRQLATSQRDALKILSHQVMAQLELRQHTCDLVESDKLLRIATECARVGLVVLTPDRRYAYANHTYSEILGLTGEKLVGRLVAEVLAPVYESQIRPRLDRAFAGERVAYDLHRCDRIFAVRVEPAENGCVVVVITDDTPYRQAQEQSRIGQERFQMVARATQDAVRDWDVTTGKIWWNESFQTQFGYSPQDFPETWEAWADHLHPLDSPRVLAGLNKAIHSQASVWWDEYRFRRQDGSYADVLDRCSMVRDAEGKVTRFGGTMQDVSERRQAEERMRFTLECSGVGLWDLDYRTGQLAWSETLEAQYGLAPGSFKGTLDAFLALIHPEDLANVIAVVRGAIQTGQDFSLSHRVVWPDGTIRSLSGAGRIHLDERGQPLRGVGISQDVTEQRELQEQYLQVQKMEVVGQLAGGVAHDFNNLLTIILGFSELLVGEPDLKEEWRESLTEVHRAGTMAASLTGQLLAVSRKQIVQPSALDLNALIAGMRSMLSRLLGDDIAVSLNLCPELPLLKADRSQMEQIVLNLIVNARDAMPRGGTLFIETGFADPLVELVVRDTGSGMTAEIQQHIFEPFFTTKEVGRGTGLGLATVHGIVNQNGGSIRVVSQVGQGSSFSLSFPPADPGEAVTLAKGPSVWPGGTNTVLVVDDADGVVSYLREVLQRHGYRVLVARCAREALRTARNHPDIEVLLTDVVMPEVSGPELAQQILQVCPSTKVLYMSGYSEDAIAQRGTLNPGVVFLQKPFSAASLLAKLREVCEVR